jgi:hypothetical protein
MNQLKRNASTRQDARSWSAQLGRLAAELPAFRPGPAFNQHNPALPDGLSTILDRLRRRHRRRQHAADKLRAQEFVMGP